jgi:hypothetical protein
MGEHNVPVGTHGTALYRELQHVPMLFYIPNNQPRKIGGAVTNLDIVPTIAELTGIDVHDLSFEGKSEVPALFYGKEDHGRIVFAETNAPTPQRAAISESYKLIYYLNSNLYELYDLKHDPWEHDNLAPMHPPVFDTMKSALDRWLERVVFARDPDFNQANEKIRDVLMNPHVAPQVPVTATLDTLAITGIGIDGQLPRLDVQVYFEPRQRTQIAYKFQVAVWGVDTATWKPTDPVPASAVHTGMHVTADGFFPSNHWHVGDQVRERFTVTLPRDLPGNALAVALIAKNPANAPNTIVLGTLPRPGSSGSGQP